jgi:urocanate hydratase
MARALRQGTGLISDYAKSGTRSQTDSGEDMVGIEHSGKEGITPPMHLGGEIWQSAECWT